MEFEERVCTQQLLATGGQALVSPQLFPWPHAFLVVSTVVCGPLVGGVAGTWRQGLLVQLWCRGERIVVIDQGRVGVQVR